MNIPVRKNVTLTTNADTIIQSVAAITGKSQGDVISEAVMTSKLQVIANFQTRKYNPVAYMIDMYRNATTNMTMEKSLALVKFVSKFMTETYLSREKLNNFADFFIDCMSGLDGKDGGKSLMWFGLSHYAIDLNELSDDDYDEKLGVDETNIEQIIYAMQMHIADRRVYANPRLFHILVIILQECIETPADLQRLMKSLGEDISDEVAANARPEPDWTKVYAEAADIIDAIF